MQTILSKIAGSVPIIIGCLPAIAIGYALQSWDFPLTSGSPQDGGKTALQVTGLVFASFGAVAMIFRLAKLWFFSRKMPGEEEISSFDMDEAIARYKADQQGQPQKPAAQPQEPAAMNSRPTFARKSPPA